MHTIADRNDIIVSDRDNHACIVVGTQVSKAKTVRYRHNDMEHLRTLLEREDPDAGKIIITDGVFSMSGMLANVPEIVKLANEFGAGVYLDDDNAIGIVVDGGRGYDSVFGQSVQVDLINDTFAMS